MDQAKFINMCILIRNLGFKAVAHATQSDSNSLFGCHLKPSSPKISQKVNQVTIKAESQASSYTKSNDSSESLLNHQSSA